MSDTIGLVEKEVIPSLNFPNDEILISQKEILARRETIDRALAMGNLEHLKVKIHFEDELGEKAVATTIWAVTDTALLLKQNVILPIHRVTKIEI